MKTLQYRPAFRERLNQSLRGCRTRLEFQLCLFEEEFCINVLGYLIPLPFLDRFHYDPTDIMESWGFTTCERSIHFNWGSRTKVLNLPWSFEHYRHEVLSPNGWVPFVGSWADDKPDGRITETHDYNYTLKSGEVQKRKATIYVERREWRWRCIPWSPWPAIKRKTIDIMFDGEVGEKTGSWKGGTVGCGWDMLPNETPLEALRRMEVEREFQ